MPEPTTISQPNNQEPILEATLQNQDMHLGEMKQLLESGLVQKSEADKEKIALAEAQLQATDQGGNKVAEAIKELKPISDAANFIANFMKAIKGERGDDGYTPTKEELLKIIEPLIDEIDVELEIT